MTTPAWHRTDHHDVRERQRNGAEVVRVLHLTHQLQEHAVAHVSERERTHLAERAEDAQVVRRPEAHSSRRRAQTEGRRGVPVHVQMAAHSSDVVRVLKPAHSLMLALEYVVVVHGRSGKRGRRCGGDEMRGGGGDEVGEDDDDGDEDG